MRALFLMVALAGCGGASYAMEAPSDVDMGGATVGEMAGDMASAEAPISPGHSAQASTEPVVGPDAPTALPVPSEQRLRLIYTAQLALTVEHDGATAAIDRVVASTLQLGGYLSHRSNRQVVVRVPSEKFHESMHAFEQVGEVSGRQVQVQDVSEEYHDLEVRIASLVALHERMRALLERTTNLEEVLRIETELGRLAREIDAARGRLRFLGSQVAWSTVTVDVNERAAEQAAPPPEEPAQPRSIRLPIEWLNETGLDGLLNLEN